MNPLNKQPKIVAMANALGLRGENRVEAIMGTLSPAGTLAV